MCVCVRAFASACACMRVCLYACACMRLHVRACVCAYACVRVYVCVSRETVLLGGRCVFQGLMYQKTRPSGHCNLDYGFLQGSKKSETACMPVSVRDGAKGAR